MPPSEIRGGRHRTEDFMAVAHKRKILERLDVIEEAVLPGTVLDFRVTWPAMPIP